MRGIVRIWRGRFKQSTGIQRAQIRNPRDRNPKEIRNPKSEKERDLCSFVRVSAYRDLCSGGGAAVFATDNGLGFAGDDTAGDGDMQDIITTGDVVHDIEHEFLEQTS